MNVGNTSPSGGAKIDSCSNLAGRAGEVSGEDCDTISIVELMSDFQCSSFCTADPNSERCKVCQGCGTASRAGATACEKQASVVCPASVFDIQCTQAPSTSVGCDCICRKKVFCAAQPPTCTTHHVRVSDSPPLVWTDTNGNPHNCDEGNHATCVTCTDPNGGPSTGNCVVHPDHCNLWNDAVNRDRCLATCSTGLLNRAYAKISGMDIQTMAGDFNCTPRGQDCDGGGVSIAECPWLSASNTFGSMQVCPQLDNTAAVGLEGMTTGANCTLDFVLSNSCGCGRTEVITGTNYGDHQTIIFGRANQPFLEYVANSGRRFRHGTRTIKLANGSTQQLPYSSDAYGAYGLECWAAGTCGYSPSYGTVVAHTEACEARHQSIIRQPAGCSVPVKALVCEEAGAWGWASGNASGHGAQTTDIAGANATASGGYWQAQCNGRRRVVDLRTVSSTLVASDPLLFLSNADASCTLRTGTGGPQSSGTPTSTN